MVLASVASASVSVNSYTAGEDPRTTDSVTADDSIVDNTRTAYFADSSLLPYKEIGACAYRTRFVEPITATA